MQYVRPVFHACFCAGLSLLIAGCSGGTRPELGQVRGKLTLDGQPVPGASVVFAPDNGGRKSMGRSNEQGEYEVTYIRSEKGAKVGPHTVHVSTINRAGGRPELLPAKYNVKSELKVEVKPGDNEFNFPMKSR